MEQNKTTFLTELTNGFEALDMPEWFQQSVKQYQRLITKPVQVGNLMIGNGESIKVQSMTNTDTMKTDATVEQIKRLVDAGCDIARITVPNLNDAKNLESIKTKLIAGGYTIPIVADVHFTPQAAMIAAEIVEKVRINPGNFVDRKRFEEKTYTEVDYQAELKRVEDKFIPLIEVCKKNGTAMRIGANHGSLSDRIINWYGDNPEGMVQSALEFLNICEQQNFDQIVFSMKSSNTLVMVAAYRLLVHRLLERGALYPIHLGVTEAGDDEDGRAKSAFGIGAMLMDGIGDTIRVSLTEDPEKEIPVAKKILRSIERFLSVAENSDDITNALGNQSIAKVINPFNFSRAKTFPVGGWGGASATQVLFSSGFPLEKKSDLGKIGIEEIKTTDKWNTKLFCPDLVYLDGKYSSLSLAGFIKEAGQQVLVSKEESSKYNIGDTYVLYSEFAKFLSDSSEQGSANTKVVVLCVADFATLKHVYLENPKKFENVIFLLDRNNVDSLRSLRHLALALKAIGVQQPLVLSLNGYLTNTDIQPFSDTEEHKIAQALYLAHLLVDGLLDGVAYLGGSEVELKYLFSILQASRQRISKPEYISCPSCGRTLFDLQEVTAKVKNATNHLVGVKIAVMGCIVNGPGEMADADFGYVGSGPGKITLYRGKEIKVRGVESEHAVARLVDLIKEEGFWQDSPQ